MGSERPTAQDRATEIAREAITDTRLAGGSDNLAAHVVIDRLIEADLLRLEARDG